MSGAFILVQKRLPVSLFTFPSLMTGLGQKFSMFVLSHFFSAFFYHTTQFITSFASDLFVRFDLEPVLHFTASGHASNYALQSASDGLIKSPVNDNLSI